MRLKQNLARERDRDSTASSWERQCTHSEARVMQALTQTMWHHIMETHCTKVDQKNFPGELVLIHHICAGLWHENHFAKRDTMKGEASDCTDIDKTEEALVAANGMPPPGSATHALVHK